MEAALVRVCLVYARNDSGTYYNQGALEVQYNGDKPDVFSGASMSIRRSTGKAISTRTCPRATWVRGELLWCFSPTVKLYGAGEVLYAKGLLIDDADVAHPVWSPTITTY